jgi:hypothetical protein
MKSNHISLQLIEKYNIVTKILLINVVDPNIYRLFFVPKLKNINFIYINNSLVIELKDERFRDKFNDWIEVLYQNLVIYDDINLIISRFNEEIRELILFSSKEKEITTEKIKGLYGELLELKRLLNFDLSNIQFALEGWHRPSPSNHDFDYEKYSLEVKTVGRSSTKIKISSEYQLEMVEQKELLLKVSKIDLVEKSSIDSLGEIYQEICEILIETPLKAIFDSKCADDVYFSYLGPKKMPFSFKIWEIESSFYKVDDLFPKISSYLLKRGISNVKYDIDISSIESFKIK